MINICYYNETGEVLSLPAGKSDNVGLGRDPA